MDREQMVKLGAEAISEWECGHGSCWSRAVLDAILPQVTTVEELEALPVETVLVTTTGMPLLLEDRVVLGMDGARLFAEAMVLHGSLTVVWRP